MGPRAGAVPAGLVLLALLLFLVPPAEAQSGEVTSVQLSIYNRTSIDVSWANTENVKHYIRWRSWSAFSTRHLPGNGPMWG